MTPRRGVRLGRLGDEVDHPVQRLQRPPGLVRQQRARSLALPSVTGPPLVRVPSASAAVAATRGRRLASSRTIRSRPSRSVVDHPRFAADEQPGQVVPAVERAAPDRQVGVEDALGHRAALQRRRPERPELGPARVAAREARDADDRPTGAPRSPTVRWPRRHARPRRPASPRTGCRSAWLTTSPTSGPSSSSTQMLVE